MIGTLRATDKDDQSATFSFSLASESSNFSIKDYGSKSLCALSIYLPFFFFACCSKRCSEDALASALVAMQQLKLHLRHSALLLKVEIILTSQSMVWFSQPDGGFREPVWDHKCCLECTTANIGNNESEWLGGLADDSLCILNSSQLRMFKEHVTHCATVLLSYKEIMEKSAHGELHQEVNYL